METFSKVETCGLYADQCRCSGMFLRRVERASNRTVDDYCSATFLDLWLAIRRYILYQAIMFGVVKGRKYDNKVPVDMSMI